MIKIPKAADLAREVESLEHSDNQRILQGIAKSLEACRAARNRTFCYIGALPDCIQKELRAAGYKLTYWDDLREGDCGYNISF